MRALHCRPNGDSLASEWMRTAALVVVWVNRGGCLARTPSNVERAPRPLLPRLMHAALPLLGSWMEERYLS
jgi:hypothetical protein